MPTMSLRPARPEDAGFLFDLYATTRAGEFEFLDETARRALVSMQFAAQRAGYAAQFPGVAHAIILSAGEPAGQILLATTSTEIRIVDVSLLPQYRRCGIGTAIYRGVIQDAAAAGKAVAASVAKSNAPSLAFHQALGFSITAESATAYSVSLVPSR